MLTFWFRRGFEVSPGSLAVMSLCRPNFHVPHLQTLKSQKPQGASHLSWGAPQPPRDFGGHIRKACPCHPPTKEGQEVPQASEQAGLLGELFPCMAALWQRLAQVFVQMSEPSASCFSGEAALPPSTPMWKMETEIYQLQSARAGIKALNLLATSSQLPLLWDALQLSLQSL